MARENRREWRSWSELCREGMKPIDMPDASKPFPERGLDQMHPLRALELEFVCPLRQRHLERMADHFDHAPQQSEPRGGWFEPDNTAARRRVERAFSATGVVAGVVVTLAGLYLVLDPQTRPTEGLIAGLYGIGAFAFGGLAYIILHTLGQGLTAMNWRALGHDLTLRQVWAILLEMALFLAAAGMIVFSGIDAVKNQSLYSAAVFVLLFALTFWPFLRHRIRHGDWPR